MGYFLTVVKDFSSKSDRDQFIRYINRWDLQKSDANLKLSPPVKPIEFWIEKTVPFKYEKAIYDGIYEWNKAFETAGFVNAIIVKRQQESDKIDPEDIRYNFFRWITSNAGFAMGPSRVNPYTGQILDADIIFDADFLTSWKQEFETFTPATIAEMTGGALDIGTNVARPEQSVFAPRMGRVDECLEVLDRAVLVVDAEEIGDVIAVVLERRGVHRQEPDAIDPELLDVVELVGHAAEISDAVVVGIEERFDWHLVEHRVLEPERFGGHRLPRSYAPGSSSGSTRRQHYRQR